jgi:DNA-directed RNA polymerase subunit M/transcription elongation factor TFIIS
MTCTNKGCGDTMEPYLDPQTDKVYCSKCDKEIVNVTYFAKAQMKASKQFKKKVIASFAVKCPKCGAEERPKLVKDDIVCRACQKPMDHLSEPFKIMLKDKLKTAGKDV